MNTANLQLEGLVLAIAGITQALVAKGLLTTEKVDRSLAVTEQTALGDNRVGSQRAFTGTGNAVFLRTLSAVAVTSQRP